jgi:hypothetical protein
MYCIECGAQIPENNVTTNPIQEINEYSPWTECRSAQFVIFKNGQI